MSKIIMISMPVTDLPRSVAFYEALGFTKSPQFAGNTMACMIWSEAIQIILLTHEVWRGLTTRPIPPSTSSEMGLALTFDSRDAVDAAHAAAVAHGGTPDINPVEDEVFMYARDFTDPDGHVWGAKWFDMAAKPTAA